ncbi:MULTISPECIES: MFS transporter [unclassified Streptomyces]|uniref:MFS transporter n=1 Tax=unclassified Streptomyces TaxID=2593676 RepID=UPI00278C61BC|nr:MULTISPECIES: MFS transporter [unclassified Streptomyces]
MAPQTLTAPTPTDTIAQRSLRKISWRLLPLLCGLYVIAFLDRQNISFATLSMQAEFGMSATAFTLGQVVFFVAYALLEVPSNLALHRFGARRWIARIMFTWGAITILTALVSNSWQFYLARFLLGAAEAGFYPGVLYYLSKWFPSSRRTAAIGVFMLAGPLATILGNPVLGMLDELGGTGGLQGWQWIFVVTGIPALLAVPLVLRRLPDSPERVSWLQDDEKAWLTGQLALEAEAAGPQSGRPLAALRDRRVLALAGFYLCFTLATYGLGFWLPTIVSGFGHLSSGAVGVISAAPFVCVAASLVVVPMLARRRGTPLGWIAALLCLAIAGFTLTASVDSPLLQMVGVTAGAVGSTASQPLVWTTIPRFLAGAAAAAGIATVNAVGNLGGGFGPMGIGVIVDRTGSAVTGLVLLIGVCFVALLATMGLRRMLP